VANVLGRIHALELAARRNTSTDVREGFDKDRARAKHTRAIKPALKKLQRRLEKARKAAGISTPPKPPSSKRRRGKGAKKAETATPSPENEEDLLSMLDSL
jgi:hypothetical protein